MTAADDAGRPGQMRSSCSCGGPGWSLRPGTWIPRTQPSPSSVTTWQGCRWPSSWQPAGPDCCRRPVSCTRSNGVEEVLVSDLADLPDRHRNLTVMLDSTWRALDSTQQRVLARLSIFTGSFTQEAAEVVAGASLNQLRALAEASLIQRFLTAPPAPGSGCTSSSGPMRCTKQRRPTPSSSRRRRPRGSTTCSDLSSKRPARPRRPRSRSSWRPSMPTSATSTQRSPGPSTAETPTWRCGYPADCSPSGSTPRLPPIT